MNESQEYEVVVGLEVHVQLQTNTKLFCGDSIAFGSEPNTQVSPITLAHPGTLPKLNGRAVEMAVRMGLACNCEINQHNFFARKNYFYPDLPKGYQVSQHTTPICGAGYITITTEEGKKNIRLNRIHLEEDAGKSVHDLDDEETSVDYNRAGTPLIEIVSEPDIRSSSEAFAYVSEIRKLVRYLDISDGNMEEGSLRCDANISVRPIGESVLGTRVEVKNLNSIRNVKRAIDFEAKRLIELARAGEKIIQQTRSFNASDSTTFAIRDKEDAEDYRYFADPDLSPVFLQDSVIENIRASLPRLQTERVLFYQENYGLSIYDATVLTEEREFADYFENIVASLSVDNKSSVTVLAKAAANWMLGPVKSWMNEKVEGINQFPISAERIGQLIMLVGDGKVSFSIASTRLFDALLNRPDADPGSLAAELNLIQQSDGSVIEPLVEQVLKKFPDKVNEYKKGKKGLLALFVGEVMKLSKGKADPKLTNEILNQKLNS